VITIIGGLGHALRYLIVDIQTTNSTAFIVVFFELWVIAWVQNRYMETLFFRTALQVVQGGALVFATWVLIGNHQAFLLLKYSKTNLPAAAG
jgi:hypothetical protein